MIDQSINGKSKYHFRRRKPVKNLTDKRDVHSVETSLIQQEQRPPRARLPCLNLGYNPTSNFTERGWLVQAHRMIRDVEEPVCEDPFQVFDVVRLHIIEVEL